MDSTAELVLKMIENLEFTAELLAAEALFTAAEKRRRYFAVRVFFSLAVCFGISGIADYSLQRQRLRRLTLPMACSWHPPIWEQQQELLPADLSLTKWEYSILSWEVSSSLPVRLC